MYIYIYLYTYKCIYTHINVHNKTEYQELAVFVIDCNCKSWLTAHSQFLPSDISLSALLC